VEQEETLTQHPHDQTA